MQCALLAKDILISSKKFFQIVGYTNIRGHTRNFVTGGPPKIISEITPRPHYKNTEYYLLSEKRNPVRNNSKQDLVLSKFGGRY